ncbi:MAG: ABC transporter ATP-binding protein/permease [Lachnospiraceae bacterium]|nr:ABC transporter ATP-binding protein/permease [Lachnospiraceae bacterium]
MKKKTKTLNKQLTAEFYKKNKLILVIAVLASLCSGTVGIAFSWVIKALLDTAAGADGSMPFADVLKVVAIILILAVTFAMMDYLSRPRFIKNAMIQYKNFAFEKLTQKNISSFKDENTALYISALTNDATSIEADYLGKKLLLITRAVSFFGALGVMLYTSPILTLAAVAVMLIPVAVSMLTGSKLVNAEKNVSDKNADFVTSVSDCLSGFKVVKSFKAEKEICNIFNGDNENLENEKYRREKIKTIIGSLGNLAGALAQFGVFIVGTLLCLKQDGMTPGVVMMFVNLMNFLIQPVAELPTLLASRKAALGLIDKLATSLEKNSEDTEGEEPASFENSIRLENVSFGYDEEKEVLHNINAEFEAGKAYAIVGGSGSGKSTLLNLLMASYRDYKGNILFDDSEMKNIRPESLYDMVSMIQQDVFVFNSSVKNNVTMFKDFAKEEIDEAITRARLDGFIKEKGDDYLCGENGKGLSGGEKQRISIARSLLKKSKVLLADEATSALDADTAFQVSADILNLTGILRIVITHSLDENLLGRYDEILVLKDGRIEEKGRFEDLMAKKGYFYALYTVAH